MVFLTAGAGWLALMMRAERTRAGHDRPTPTGCCTAPRIPTRSKTKTHPCWRRSSVRDHAAAWAGRYCAASVTYSAWP
jgi:hypothetical protein